MNFIKKASIVLALAAVFTFLGGCGVSPEQLGIGTTTVPEGSATASEATADEVNAASFKNDITGLEQYLKELELLSGDTTEMSAEQIGAAKGFRWSFKNKNDSQVTLEIYEYNPQKLNTLAKDIIKQVKNTGKFKLYSLPEVAATLQNDDKYLVIYKDPALDGDAPSEDAKKAKSDLINAIDTFKGK
ncbi:MAG: hypothetical protein LBM65_05805 [Oscillospiraceae bacterium]|jgi:hypothetical protein|nr:hypothetical protein [Oscillospiraceae bacterium]